MIYLYRESGDTFYVSKEVKEGVLESFADDELQYMDLALDHISSIGVVNAYTVIDRTK